MFGPELSEGNLRFLKPYKSLEKCEQVFNKRNKLDLDYETSVIFT